MIIQERPPLSQKLSPFCVNWTLKVQHILYYKINVQDKLLRRAGTFGSATQAAVIYNGIFFLQFLNHSHVDQITPHTPIDRHKYYSILTTIPFFCNYKCSRGCTRWRRTGPGFLLEMPQSLPEDGCSWTRLACTPLCS